MQNHYGDEHHHKHDKSHLVFRRHYKTHPVTIQIDEVDNETLSNLERSTGHIRQGNLKKVRTKIQRHHEYRATRL